jgi:hypothetical protein
MLLKDSPSCTPTDHPDFAALQIACKEMSFVVGGINEVKRRKGMVQSIVRHERNETGINKGVSRRAEKLKQSVGISDTFVEKMYDKLVENDNKHCAQVEVIARDIETAHVDRFIQFSSSIKGFFPQPAPKKSGARPANSASPKQESSHAQPACAAYSQSTSLRSVGIYLKTVCTGNRACVGSLFIFNSLYCPDNPPHFLRIC